MHHTGRFEEAEHCFRRLLTDDPRDAEALFHLGALLFRRGELEQAAETYRRALALTPADVHLWLRLGDACLARNTHDSLREAAEAFERAIALQGDCAEAHFNLGCVRNLQDLHEQAVESFRTALALRPESPVFQANLLNEMQIVCDWSRLEELCRMRRQSALLEPADPALRAEDPAHPFGLLSIPSTPAEQLACARTFSRWIAARVAAERKGGRFAFGRPARQRRRIGYLSGEFHEHAIAFLSAELFELHDRSRFEVFGYSYGPDDGSAMRARLERGFDRFVDVRLLPDSRVAEAIHADAVDILIDIKGYTIHARPDILAWRAAPVQVSYLGYPGTSGAEFLDYLVGDRFVTPPQRAAEFAEALAVLPDCYQVNDRRRAIGPTPTRRALGLPDGAVVFCCFNQSYKILPESFAAWMRIVQAVPGSVLWLLQSNSRAVHNLRREAEALGVEPGRLIFAPIVPLTQHLARIAAADLFLDSFPYTAHTTASDALWAGLPVLTRAGETFASRVAGSLLTAVGLPELVTRSLTEFEALAIRLARAPGALQALRHRLMANRRSAPLFDTPRFVRNLEAAYEEMWRIHAAGGAPRLIQV